MGLDILRDLERRSALVNGEIGDWHLWFDLCARSGFTPHMEQEARTRGDVLRFDLPQMIAGAKSDLGSVTKRPP